MLRIQKRTALPVWKSWLIRAIAIIIALVLNGVLIYGLTKMNPVKVYATMFNGVFGTERRIWNTIRDISMLLCWASRCSSTAPLRRRTAALGMCCGIS